MKNKFKIAACLGLFFFVLARPAFATDEIDFPDPTGYVNDFANIIDNDEELEQKLRTLEEETTIEFVVITTESLQGYSIDEFGTRLWEQDPWKIGKEESDNGVMLLVAPNEKRVRIGVGYGLEGTLPAGMAGLIIEKEIKPYFKEDKYSEGINAGVDEVITILRGQESVYAAEYNQLDIWEDVLYPMSCLTFFVPITVLLVFDRLLGRVKGIWLGGLIGGLVGSLSTIGFWDTIGYWSLASIPLSVGAGLIADKLAGTKEKKKAGEGGTWFSTWIGSHTGSGTFGGSSGGGGFGGFGGGSSGGGGASSGW